MKVRFSISPFNFMDVVFSRVILICHRKGLVGVGLHREKDGPGGVSSEKLSLVHYHRSHN